VKTLSALLEERARLILIAAGLALILAGNAFELSILKINIAALFAEVGALLLIVGLLHWLFESSMRRQLTQDIFNAVVGAGRTSSSGIVDVFSNSREVRYDDMVKSAKRLIIGEHYSTRFFEDHAPEIRERLARHDETIALLLKQSSQASKYLRASGSWYGAKETLAKIRELTKEPSNGSITQAAKDDQRLTIKLHTRVLRYSFVMSEDHIWIRFFTNSEGESLVPAFCIAKGTQLYDFFSTDIMRLLEQSENSIP
jgi:hypothetical protein